MKSEFASPLLPLAYGFLALVPLPLVALFFAGESDLTRRVEIWLATVFVLFGLVFLVAARRAASREDAHDPNRESDG